jgi:thiol-disulfide isomerase/thioredoxin
MENQKSKFTKTIEVLTNVSIIIVALIGAVVLVKNYLLRPAVAANQPSLASVTREQAPERGERPNSTGPSGPAAGSQISLPGINFSDSDETVVLALSDKCHFCTESAPFYQRLTQELAASKKVRVVAVFPQEVDAGKKYLDGLKVPITDVAQATLNTFGVRGTPTLMVVDKNGTVQQTWVGKLTPERETEVLSRIKT